jgi:D-arabinose 5-phosphate isomerase GutQ
MNELATQCIDRQIAALSRLHHVIQTGEYEKLVQLVTNVARLEYKARVLVAGVGKNSNIASKISETMASLGIPSMALNVSHLGHGDYGFIGPHDAIIHISRSGQTREMLEAIDHIALIRPNVSQVLIHCKKDKPVNKAVEIELFIGSVAEGDEFSLAPTTSTTALLCTLDCVSVQVSHNIGFKRLDFLKFHPSGALGAMLTAEVEAKSSSDKTTP